MTIHGPSFRTVLLSTAAFCLFFFLAARSFGGDEARPIASLTPEERSTGLPDNTQVKLASGRTATLGVLRAEHRARLERFTKAAELGKMVAAKFAAASSTQTSQAATERHLGIFKETPEKVESSGEKVKTARSGEASTSNPVPAPPSPPSGGVKPSAVTGTTPSAKEATQESLKESLRSEHEQSRSRTITRAEGPNSDC